MSPYTRAFPSTCSAASSSTMRCRTRTSPTRRSTRPPARSYSTTRSAPRRAPARWPRALAALAHEVRAIPRALEPARGRRPHGRRLPERVHGPTAGDHQHLADLRRVLPGALLRGAPGAARGAAGRGSLAVAAVGAADGHGPDRDLSTEPAAGPGSVDLDRRRPGRVPCSDPAGRRPAQA